MNDKLMLTIRLWDPMERQDVDKSARWVMTHVDREDLQLSKEEFAARYLTPAVPQLIPGK